MLIILCLTTSKSSIKARHLGGSAFLHIFIYKLEVPEQALSVIPLRFGIVV